MVGTHVARMCEAGHMGRVVHWMMKGGDVSMSYVAVLPIVDAQGMVPSVVNELWKLVRTHCTLGSVAADIGPAGRGWRGRGR